MQRLAQQCISLCPRTRRSPRWWLHGEGCSEREEPLHMKVLTGTWNLPEQGQGWALRQLRNCLLGQTEHWACKSLLLWTLFRFIFFEVNIWYKKKKNIGITHLHKSHVHLKERNKTLHTAEEHPFAPCNHSWLFSKPGFTFCFTPLSPSFHPWSWIFLSSYFSCIY